MTDDHDRGQGEHPRRGPALARAVPGALVVVKYGGNAMVDDELKLAFAQDVAFLRYAGLRPVVVHGGGPQIQAMLDRLGLESEFKGGLRVTTPEVMDVVRMVLTGQVGRELVGLLNQHGPIAVGLSGEDGALFGARRRGVVVDGVEEDLGLVGDVVTVNTAVGRRPARRGPHPRRLHRRPRPRPRGPGPQRQRRHRRRSPRRPRSARASSSSSPTSRACMPRGPTGRSLLSTLPLSRARELLRTVDSGMIPKLEACIRAVEDGVPQAHVIDGREPHALLLEVFTSEGIGTLIEEDA